MRDFSLLINVFVNVFMVFLCKPSVATIKSYSSVPTFSFSPNSSPSVPTPFSCKTSVATWLSLQSQPFSHKHSVGSPQLHHFSPKPSVATGFSCNPVFSVPRHELQSFSPNPSFAAPKFQSEAFTCNPSVQTL